MLSTQLTMINFCKVGQDSLAEAWHKRLKQQNSLRHLAGRSHTCKTSVNRMTFVGCACSEDSLHNSQITPKPVLFNLWDGVRTSADKKILSRGWQTLQTRIVEKLSVLETLRKQGAWVWIMSRQYLRKILAATILWTNTREREREETVP